MRLLHDIGLPSGFSPYTPTHGLVILATAATVAVLVRRRQRLAALPAPAARRFDTALGIGCAVIFLLALARELTRGVIDLKQAIPLHICDWALLCAVVAYCFEWRPARTFLHYAGLTLSVQAYITPVLTAGPAYTQFYLSWLFHGAIMVAALVDVLARGYRPGWEDFRVATRWGTVYILLVFPLNAIFGWNYGYVGPADPATASRAATLALFGPWPTRVPILYGTVCAFFAAITLAWNWRAFTTRVSRIVETLQARRRTATHPTA